MLKLNLRFVAFVGLHLEAEIVGPQSSHTYPLANVSVLLYNANVWLSIGAQQPSAVLHDVKVTDRFRSLVSRCHLMWRQVIDHLTSRERGTRELYF